MLLNYGKYYRVWPFADVRHNELYVSIALLRPFVKPICKLLQSKDYGESWNEVGDFYSMDKRNTTTGQPFVTRDGTVLIPVWNAGFYTDGTPWLAIYKSDDFGLSWHKVYKDFEGTYGKHFFQSPNGNLYIGVGFGGGGSKGRVSSTPRKSYLLKSGNMGKTWRKILHVDYPTSLYSGVALNDKTIIVAAREKKSLFLSENGGKTWKEIRLGNTARNISYIEELGKIVVTSNSALFVSNDALEWTRVSAPIKGLMLRYPTWHKNRLYMSGVGWRGYIVSTNLNKWYLSFDITKETGSNLGARIAILNDSIFVGDEANGTLIRIKFPLDNKSSVTLPDMLKANVNYFTLLTKLIVKRVMGQT